MTQHTINSLLLSVFGAGLSCRAAWFWFRKNAAIKEAERLANDHRRLEDRVREMETQMSAMKSAVVPISAAFQAILVKELTHFHTPEMDALLEKLGPPLTITEAEEEDLRRLLKEREQVVDTRISESERDAAHMLPLVMRRVRAELSADENTPVDLQLVAVTHDDTAPVVPAPEESIPNDRRTR